MPRPSLRLGHFLGAVKAGQTPKAVTMIFIPNLPSRPTEFSCHSLMKCFCIWQLRALTSDFMADTLDAWWNSNRKQFSHIQTLLINQDNGPENHSRRTQFMKRMVEFSNTHKLNLRLAYYPPYHSKYNPIERVWGVLEHHWNGDILDEIETVVKFAYPTHRLGKLPVITLVTQIYQIGVKLTQKAMTQVETQIQRLTNSKLEELPDLGKWFVDISYRQGA